MAVQKNGAMGSERRSSNQGSISPRNNHNSMIGNGLQNAIYKRQINPYLDDSINRI